MSAWWRRLLEFLKGFLPAAWKSYFDERRRLQLMADRSAEEQREADAKAEAKLVKEAKDRRDEIGHLSDDEFDHRAGRWVRPPH